MLRKQYIILAVLLLFMVPGSSKIPEIAKQTLALSKHTKQNVRPQHTDSVKQAYFTDPEVKTSKNQEQDTAQKRYKRAQRIQDIDKFKAMSEREAKRIMRTGDTKTYRKELERNDLIPSQ